MAESLGQRIKLVRGKISQDVFAVTIGVSRGSLSAYERDESQPAAEVLKEICTKYKVSADWLLFGEGGLESTPLEAPIGDVDLKLIPLVEARISAGQGSLEVNGTSERSYAFRMDFLLRKGNPDAMVLMRVAGDSMQPEIMDNDIVLIDQSKKDIIPGKIFAVGFEEAIYLKRIDMIPGKVILKSVNEECYPPISLDIQGDIAEQFRVIGKVIWSGREYR
ncbi:MAG: helix-turn-helix transcriptional regulator [Desulfovibrio sp.]|uniref:XRE family transcriptional regulator n=1 Tax=Desulfovibrio sp. TaxID=885 RepID=UPI0025C1F7AE|nr:S24 family peptidase [Desulfovibrio sp.]MBS6831204.1 helix-turn-helix transcriptional regulator [Desulfovibrio sp.]